MTQKAHLVGRDFSQLDLLNIPVFPSKLIAQTDTLALGLQQSENFQSSDHHGFQVS